VLSYAQPHLAELLGKKCWIHLSHLAPSFAPLRSHAGFCLEPPSLGLRLKGYISCPSKLLSVLQSAQEAKVILSDSTEGHGLSASLLRIIHPSRKTPGPGLGLDSQLQALDEPLVVHADSSPHGLSVTRSGAATTSICTIAPQAYHQTCQTHKIHLSNRNWENSQVAKFLPASSGSPNQYFSNPPDSTASRCAALSSSPSNCLSAC
jgi:hypothetical protein